MLIESNPALTAEYTDFAKSIHNSIRISVPIEEINLIPVQKKWQFEDLSADVRYFLELKYHDNLSNKNRIISMDLQNAFLDFKKGISFDACVERINQEIGINYKSDKNIVKELSEESLERD